MLALIVGVGGNFFQILIKGAGGIRLTWVDFFNKRPCTHII